MRIELYGVLGEVAGDPSIEIDVSVPARVEEVLAALADREPRLEPHLPRVACAVGDELIPRSGTVDGHEPLVLLPPVSGG